MRSLVSFETRSGERGFGLLQDDSVVDFSEGQWADLGAFLGACEGFEPWNESLANRPRLALADLKLHAPIPKPPKIAAVGLNYQEHALEQDKEAPKEPMFFCKARTSVIGPGETIILPPGREEIDVEVELVVVFGKTARNVSQENALDCVLGYTIGNDVSDRKYQRDDKQFYRAKSFETFAPLGPSVALREDYDPRSGFVRLWRSGFAQQDGNLSQLIHSIEKLISLLSEVHTIEPGDLLFTGTPSGVGAHRKPPLFLKDGDEIVCEVEGLGRLVNPVRRF